MADIPQEVRDALELLDGTKMQRLDRIRLRRAIGKVLLAGKRAGMERAAEIADVARGNWADCSRRFPDTPAIDAALCIKRTKAVTFATKGDTSASVCGAAPEKERVK